MYAEENCGPESRRRDKREWWLTVAAVARERGGRGPWAQMAVREFRAKDFDLWLVVVSLSLTPSSVAFLYSLSLSLSVSLVLPFIGYIYLSFYYSIPKKSPFFSSFISASNCKPIRHSSSTSPAHQQAAVTTRIYPSCFEREIDVPLTSRVVFPL